MQKNMIGFTLLVFMVNTTFSFADKANKKNTTTEYTELIVLDKGVKRTIRVLKTDEQKSAISNLSTKPMFSKKGIVLAFKKSSKVDIFELERKYGLKLKKKLVIGYYIFENVSDRDDMEIVSSIITNEKNVKTVKPNWKKNNQPR